MSENIWYLQKDLEDNGFVFWDSYLHEGCVSVGSTNINPFKGE